MKSASIVVVALGLFLAMAAPSLAHGHGPVHHYYHGYAGPYVYGTYSPVVVAPAVVVTPAPVYATPYPPVIAPAIVPAPYYYGVPRVGFGYRGPHVAVRIGL